MIPVLLIDDQPLNPLILIAKNRYNIEITQFFNLEEAQEELKRHDYYKAVILDCYCSKDSSNELHSNFLTRAISCINNSGKMPWYIYTGGTEKGDFPSIIDNLPGEVDNPWKQWDPFNEKGYYSKSGAAAEIELLLSRIVNLDKERNDVISHYKKYVDIIKKCCQGPTNNESRCTCLSEAIIDNLIRILIPIYYNRIEDCSDDVLGKNFRTCLEDFLSSSVDNGTMPHALDKRTKLYDSNSQINCFIGKNYSFYKNTSNDIKEPNWIKIDKEESLTRTRLIPTFISKTLHEMRQIGNSASHSPNKRYEKNQSQNRSEKCGGYLKNQFVSCCFNFLDLLLWYDLEFDNLKKNAEQCRRIKEEKKERDEQVIENIPPKSENLVTNGIHSVSNIPQPENSEKKDYLQESHQTFIQKDEEAEDDITLDTTKSLNIEVESLDCHQTDIPQDDKVFDTIVTLNTPPMNEKIYVVKSFKNHRGNTFRYCEYESKNALFDSKASVEEGDKIILMRVPIDNDITSLKKTYPLYIPEFSYKKVNT